MKKNVLFIVIDSVTNDILFNKNTSSLCAPFLNELRKKSISGDKMFSEAPYTEAALMCLLGGIDTMDNGGYMERFKDKTCVLEVFRNNGYKVFHNNYYPSIYPSYMAPGYDERKYIEGFQFSHIWDYRLKYYSEIFEKNEINNKEYKILADMLDDNFKNWIIYLEKIKNNDNETSMLNGNIDVSDIDNDIKQIKVEYEKFSKDNKKYLNSLFEQKENHQLFNIKTYMMSDKVHDNIVRNKVIEKYKTTFDRINKMNFENNLLNNKLPIKNIIKSIINKDFKTAKGLLAGYKNSLFDKDLYDRISNNYDQFKVQRSFYTVSQELFVWIKENKDKKWMSYVDSDDFVEKDMYKKLYNKAKENNYDIVVCGNYNVSEDYQNKNIDAFINNYNTDLENIFFGKMAVWNKIYKRDILIKNKLEFKEKVWYEDLAFTLKAIMNSNTFAFIDEPLYDYLIREGSTMNNSNVQRNLEILDAFNDILSYIQHNKKEEYFSKIEFLAIDHIYISAIVRVLKAEADDKVKRETINKLIDYMNKKFPNYKNNKYINTLSKNRKIIYKLINIKMYGLINLIFKVKKG